MIRWPFVRRARLDAANAIIRILERNQKPAELTFAEFEATLTKAQASIGGVKKGRARPRKKLDANSAA